MDHMNLRWFVLCFQSDVMQLTDDSTKLKLFMDVLDGAKAAVSHQFFPCHFSISSPLFPFYSLTLRVSFS